jgi:hypothetical protein
MRLTGSAPLNPQFVLQNSIFFLVQQMIDKFHAESNSKNFGFCFFGVFSPSLKGDVYVVVGYNSYKLKAIYFLRGLGEKS